MGAYESGASPTYAVVSRFAVTRVRRGLLFRWRVAESRTIIGFTLWARSHRLTPRLIPAHASRAYRLVTHSAPCGPYTLQILLRGGNTATVHIS
jgi:hypothetical protein